MLQQEVLKMYFAIMFQSPWASRADSTLPKCLSFLSEKDTFDFLTCTKMAHTEVTCQH